MFAFPKTVAMLAMVLATAFATVALAIGDRDPQPDQNRREAVPRGGTFVVLDISTGSSNPTSSDSVTYTVAFSRDPANFDNPGAVIVTTTESLTYTMITFSPPSLNSVNVTFEGLEGEGELSIDVSTSSGIVDTLGTPLGLGRVSPVILVDRLAPRTMATGPTGTVYVVDQPYFDVDWVGEDNGVGLEWVELWWSRSSTPFGFTNFEPYDYNLFNSSPIEVQTAYMPGTGNYFAFYTTGIDTGFLNHEPHPPTPDIIVYFKSLSSSVDILVGAETGCVKCLPGEEPAPGSRGGGGISGPKFVDIDPGTGAIISSTPITMLTPDIFLAEVWGMDDHPATGEMWIAGFAFSIQGGNRADRGGFFGPALVRGSSVTGEVELVGTLPDEFDSIAFSPDGTLYGIMSRFAFPPNTMWRLDTTGAGMHTELFAVTNGSGGSTGLHAFDWMTSPTLFMNVSGFGNFDHFVEFIDPITGPVSNLLPGGDDFFRADGASTLGDWLYVMSTSAELFRTDEQGNFEFIGFSGGDISALATGKNPDLCPVYFRNYVVDDADSSFGNDNGAVDPGETLGLFLGLRNEFGLDATGISAWLEDCTVPGITLINDTSTYPNLTPTEEQFNDVPFIVEIPFGQPCTTLSFKLHVTTDLTSCTIPITIPMGTAGTMPVGESFDIEGPQSDWILTGQWRFAVDDQCTTPTPLYSSPVTSLACNVEGFCEYSNGLFATAELDRSYVVSGGPNPSEFRFMHNLETEPGFDFASVEATTDGGENWFTIWEFQDNRGGGGPARGSVIGTNGLWEPVAISLEPFDGETLRFRFLFTSDGSVTYRGWYVDDVAIVTNERLCEPFEPLMPCPTGTPIPTPSPSPTPTATMTPTMTPAPSPTPPVFVPAVFSVEGLPGEIRATHSGVATVPLRHFVAFWSREANLQSNRWRYEGFVEYQNGEQTTSIPWKAPTSGKRHEFAARLFIEGTGFSGPFVYGILTDLPPQFPVIESVVYDDANREIVISFDPVGGLTCSIGAWRRHIFVPPVAPETSATALGNWQYLGVTPYPLNSSELRIPFDRGSVSLEMAFAVWIKGAGFVLPYTFQIAPSEATVYPNLHTILPIAELGKVSTSFSPVGNVPAKVGLWFRQRGGKGGCEVVCDWTFVDLYDYTPLTRELDFPWYPASSKDRHDVAMRVFAEDMFGALAPTGPFVYHTLCDVSGDPPQLPTPSPTVSPTPTATATSTATPTPTATPTVTPTGTDIVERR